MARDHHKRLAGALALSSTLAVTLAACAGENSEPTQGPETTMTQTQEPSIRDVTVEEASALIESDTPVVVLDVRTAKEFGEGHIPGAINLDVMSEDFPAQLAQLDPAQTFVLHCKSGARSAKALEAMKEQSFVSLAHMNQGFDAWAASGLAVEQ